MTGDQQVMPGGVVGAIEYTRAFREASVESLTAGCQQSIQAPPDVVLTYVTTPPAPPNSDVIAGTTENGAVAGTTKSADGPAPPTKLSCPDPPRTNEPSDASTAVKPDASNNVSLLTIIGNKKMAPRLPTPGDERLAACQADKSGGRTCRDRVRMTYVRDIGPPDSAGYPPTINALAARRGDVGWPAPP